MNKATIQQDDMQSIKEVIVRIVGDHLGIPGAALSLNTNIVDDLGADSLDHVELIMTIEERFRIKIPQDDIVRLQRIEDIVTYVRRVLPNKSK